MRYLLALVIAAGCNAQASIPPAPRNLVCQRVALLSPDATCLPEYTDAGERHTHSAIVTQGTERVSCAINDATLSMVCGPLVAQPKQD
jgi:hypothetical protein